MMHTFTEIMRYPEIQRGKLRKSVTFIFKALNLALHKKFEKTV